MIFLKMSKLWCFSVQEYTKVHKLHNPFPQKYLLICIHFEVGYILNLEQIFKALFCPTKDIFSCSFRFRLH